MYSVHVCSYMCIMYIMCVCVCVCVCVCACLCACTCVRNRINIPNYVINSITANLLCILSAHHRCSYRVFLKLIPDLASKSLLINSLGHLRALAGASIKNYSGKTRLHAISVNLIVNLKLGDLCT